ncbi:downstream neighbor of Son [Tasmannia lanceolata]|uniref:downstream neighbor of Son n=1 Tax=Tasmannia lanceolata TaxID=3420 RepID=UPI0040646E1D
MAEVAIPDPLSSKSFPFGKGSSKVQANAPMKRKTPSELRGEQLKRRNCGKPDESFDHLLGSDGSAGGKVHGLRKPDSAKTPKYIDTRVDEVYPVKKSSAMFRMLYGKEKAKDSFPFSEQTNDAKNCSAACNIAAKSQSQLSCGKGGDPNISNIIAASAEAIPEQGSSKIEKCSQNMFRSVAQLSLGNETFSDPAIFDMNTALKGLVARDACLPCDFSGKSGGLPSLSLGSFCSEVNIPGYKTPLDFTLKTSMRLISSSSVSWCHRLGTSSAFTVMTQLTSQFGRAWDQNVGDPSGFSRTPEVMYSKALHSWTYPQSSLPPSIISAMTISAARGEMDFLLKRQLAWEDSFRGLYYLLRKNKCDIFYFYTTQFVVMFIGGEFLGKTKHSCNAYLSQSTRGLRSLLREHDISFTMPLCHSKVEQAAEEDLVELSEIEKSNVGQTRRFNSMSDVDNSSQSLLAFIGNENVHGLYDFLLNYRSFLTSLTSIDVPVLYSHVPFQNASLCVPEVICREVNRANVVLPTPRGDGEALQDSSGICYSIEIKDAILPPWTICGVCAAMGSDGRSFEASFATEPLSTGLNVALDTVCQKSDTKTESGKVLPEGNKAFGIEEAVIAPCLRSASLRGLKYSNGSYMASLLPL